MKADLKNSRERNRFIVIVGVMSAVSVVLAYLIHVPLIPAAPFLEYDPADIVIYACTYLMGVPCGLLITLVVSVVQGITVSASSGIIGIIMHFISTGSFVVVSGLVFKAMNKKKKHPVASVVVATVAGIITATVVMVLWNVILTPIYMKVPRQMVMDGLMTIYIPFNLLKATFNGVGSAVLYYPVKKALGF